MKKGKSRLGTACKVLGTVYLVAYGLVYLWTLSIAGAYSLSIIWSILLQLLAMSINGVTLWALGVLLERQKEDREALAELKALLGGDTQEGENEAPVEPEVALEETPPDETAKETEETQENEEEQ